MQRIWSIKFYVKMTIPSGEIIIEHQTDFLGK
jgi:hypothetical protein